MNKSVRTKQVLDSVCPGYQSRNTGQRGQAVVRLVSEKQPRDAWAFPAVEQAQATPSTNDYTVIDCPVVPRATWSSQSPGFSWFFQEPP